MRLARVAHQDGMSFVSLEGKGDAISALEIAEHPFGTPTFTGRKWPIANVRLLSPILPGKVVCVGKNYAEHAKEMGGTTPADPVIFLKPSTSVIGEGNAIRLPSNSSRVDYEGELAVVIGRPCKNVRAEDVKSVILGYTVANDVTARDHQQADGQWTRAKGHDTFCPLGPWIETELDPSDLGIRTELDGEVKQNSRTSELRHGVGELIAWITKVMTLLPGDVVLTGTPAGVGPMREGQLVSVTIEGIGTLTNPVAS